MQGTIGPDHQLIVVDDDPLYTRLVELVLKSLKYPGESKIINNPLDLMPFLLPPGPPPRLEKKRIILLDHSMPQMSGFALLKAIRLEPQTRAIPVVVMSGVMEPSHVKEAYLHGASACMTKPDELDDFFIIFDRLLEHWFSLCRVPKT